MLRDPEDEVGGCGLGFRVGSFIRVAKKVSISYDSIKVLFGTSLG